MSASKVRKKLIDKLKKIDDEVILKGAYDLIRDESKKEMLILSRRQVKAIHRAEIQIAKGKFLTDSQVRKSTSQWLEK